MKSGETSGVPSKKPKNDNRPNHDGRAHPGGSDVLEKMANEVAEGAPRPGSSFGRAIRDVAILAILLGGGMYAYRNHVTTKDAVQKLALEASERMEKDDLASLRKAEESYKKILELDGDSDIGLSGIAETYFHQSRHGLPTRDKAEEFLRRAEKENSKRAERYATAAYLQITGGHAVEAESQMKDLLDRGVFSSKIAHAYGWALLENGKTVDSNRVVTQALEMDFNAVRYPLTLAEAAHRQGDERAAVRQLRKVLSSSMNAEHEIALAWLAALSAKNYGNVATPAKYIQQIQAKKDKIGPVAEAMLAWAEGELALAMGNSGGALEKVEQSLALRKDFPPVMDLKARATAAQGKNKEALEIYNAAVAMRPAYRGTQWALAEFRSLQKDPGALALVEELEKSHVGTPGPEYEIFRGEHYLRMKDIEQAKASFTRAAELGDDAAILFGLAKVTFEEEKKKDKKADLEKVAEAFSAALDARPIFPEAHAFMAQISLWNLQADGADGSYKEAETAYKKLNRPIAEVLRFYDAAAQSFTDMGGKKQANDLAGAWKKRKEQYLATVITETAPE